LPESTGFVDTMAVNCVGQSCADHCRPRLARSHVLAWPDLVLTE